MTKHLQGRGTPRGIVAVRADAGSDPAALITDLNKAFAEFKEEHQKHIRDVQSGLEDCVRAEKIERINAEISSLQSAVDAVNSNLAAIETGGMGGEGRQSAEVRAHAQAFDQWFRRGRESEVLARGPRAELTTSSDPDAGFVVPEQMESAIDRTLSRVSALRQLARVISISSPVYKKLISTGRAGAEWVGETEARTETAAPSLSAITLTVHELAAVPAASQQLLEDAFVDIAAWLAEEVAEKFAEAEGAAFIDGSGAGRPRGILSYPTVANASYSWGNIGFVKSGKATDFADTDPANALIDLVYALRQGYRSNARFLMSDVVNAKVRKITDKDGQYLWQPPLQAGEPAQLLGYPVVTDDNMPAVEAGTFPIAFADFQRAYTVVDRVGITVLRDPFTARPNVEFFTRKRVGGGVTNYEALKLLKIAN